MPTFWPRRPTPTQRTRASLASAARVGAEGAVGEDVDLGARIGADQRPRGADGLGQPGRQVAGVGAADRRQRPVAVARQRRGHGRLHAGLDHHDLGALAQPAHQRRPPPPRATSNREGDTSRAFIEADSVEDDHDLAGALAHHGGDGTRQRQREREQREDLEDQQRIALQALEERGRLAVAQRRLPQQQARHPPLAPAHLEEVEEHQRQRQREGRERERGEEAHPSTRPRSWATTNASTGVSVTTRW